MPKPRPFLGIDGEGAGVDAAGRQIYRLLVAGEHVLDGASDGIHTETALNFILGLPRRPILVGYYSDYDVTMILRDLEEKYLRRLYDRHDNYGGTGIYTWWRGYGLEVVPGMRFRVCLLDRETNKPIPRTARTIHNVASFFRLPFVAACKLYGVATTAELRQLAHGKARRGGPQLDARAIEYCKLECRLLAELMEKLRAACLAAEAAPAQNRWQGPGLIANALLRQHGIPRRPETGAAELRRDVAHVEHHYPDDPRWLDMVRLAQFGGRSETRILGPIDGPIWIYDMRSAYPAALLELPCPQHTHWHRFRGAPKGWRWYVAAGRYSGARSDWGALPARRADQSVCFPRSVEGAWWSPEIEGLDGFRFAGGYGADRECDCHPWNWVREAYGRRQALGAEIGYPIKIGLAALYGKLAQYRGSSTWRDIPAASLVTSWVRRRMRDMLWRLGESAIMASTDGVFSFDRADVHLGASLGEWRETHRKSLNIVQPGIHFTDAEMSHRGFNRDTMAKHAPLLMERWLEFLENPLAPLVEYPAIDIPVDVFVGARLAIREGLATPAGTWRKIELPLQFSFQGKREHARIEGEYLVSDTLRKHHKSVPYDPERIDKSEKLKLMLEANPDAGP